MPDFYVSMDVLNNIAHHLSQEARYFEQEVEPDKAEEFAQAAENFDELTSSGAREATIIIRNLIPS